jgi:outer membrane lipoprotein SlyB
MQNSISTHPRAVDPSAVLNVDLAGVCHPSVAVNDTFEEKMCWRQAQAAVQDPVGAIQAARTRYVKEMTQSAATGAVVGYTAVGLTSCAIGAGFGGPPAWGAAALLGLGSGIYRHRVLGQQAATSTLLEDISELERDCDQMPASRLPSSMISRVNKLGRSCYLAGGFVERCYDRLYYDLTAKGCVP